MQDHIIAERTFRGIDGEGRRIDVSARLHRLGRQSPYFSVTSNRGSDHDRIVTVFPELSDVVVLHLSDEDGAPMHAVENLRYHLENGDMDAARRHCRIAADGDIEALAGKILLSRKSVAERAAVIEKELVEDLGNEVRNRTRKSQSFLRLHVNTTVSGFDLTVPKDAEEFFSKIVFSKEAVGSRVDSVLERLPANFRADIAEFRKKAKSISSVAKARAASELDPVVAFVDMLRPAWKEQAMSALSFLKDGPVVAAGYVPSEEDKATFAGFAKAVEVTLSIVSSTRRKDGGTDFVVRIDGPRSSFETPFMQGSAYREAPTIERVLECLRLDAFSADRTFEDWCSEYGYDTDSRSAERSYEACRKTRQDLASALGDEEFHFLIEKVGEDEPVFQEGMDDEAGPSPSF